MLQRRNGRYCKTEIQGAGDGRLRGRSVAIKDSIPVAGVPMMNGSRILEGYVPDFDATVVTRVLEAGKSSSSYPCAAGGWKANPPLTCVDVACCYRRDSGGQGGI